MEYRESNKKIQSTIYFISHHTYNQYDKIIISSLFIRVFLNPLNLQRL